MKNSLVGIVGVVLTVACLFLYFSKGRVLQIVDLAAYDSLLRLSHTRAKSDQIVIVDLDEASLVAYGQWPWPRYLIADLTDALFENGAAVVLFDMVFSEPDRTSPSEYLTSLNRRFSSNVVLENLPAEAQDFEALLAASLSGRKTVLGCRLYDEIDVPVPFAPPARSPAFSTILRPRDGKADSDEVYRRIRKAQAIEMGLPQLVDASAGIGFINADPDVDSVSRRCPLMWRDEENTIYPSLALEALRQALDADLLVIDYDERGILHMQLDDLEIPTDTSGRVLLNYRSPNRETGRSFPYLSARDVLERNLLDGSVSNKIVFVGTSAAGLRDFDSTPLTVDLPGVETHATVIDTVLSGDVLRQPEWIQGTELFAMICMGLLLTFLIHSGRSWLAVAFAIVFFVLSVASSIFLIRQFQLVFIPTRLVMAIGMIFSSLTSIRYCQEETKRKSLRSMFGPMVSREVLEYMEESPDSYARARDVEATIFFSDIQGFTPIAEGLSAGDVTDFLNQYLSAMNKVILRRKGYLDKYNGDAIMAVWGVPYPMRDHASQACLSALEQAVELESLRDKLKARFGYEVHVRMGINSGKVKAGNMGSLERMQYTVIGDAVNQAARMEPINKQYGTSIIIGEETYRLAREVIEARLMDRIIVKGKTKPVKIYELLAPKGELPESFQKLLSYYESALRLHWDRNWGEALEAIEAALEIQPGDGPSLVLKRRIEQYQLMEPQSEWDGAFVYSIK